MKRKHVSRSQSTGKKGSEDSGRQKNREDGSSPSGFWKIILVVLALVVLAALIYVAFPADYTGKHSEEGPGSRKTEPPKKTVKSAVEDSDSKPTTESAENDEPLRDEDFEKWIRDNAVPCEKLMDEAKIILDKHPKRDWESALDLLATCVLQEPENPAPRWNLAVALIQLNRIEEALQFVDEALELDPYNVVFLKTGGVFLSQMGYHREAIRCLEWYLAVSLHVPSWEQLLASISVQREDEWDFLHEAGDDVMEIFEVLLSSYLQSKSLIKAGYLYKVLIGLKGRDTDAELLVAYSFFSLGLGDLENGMKYLRKYTEHQYIKQEYGDADQAFEVVTAHSLRLFSAGFDAHMISIGRNLLMAGEEVWDELVYNCELTENDTISFSRSVKLSDLRKIFIKCLLVQNVIGHLLEQGAVVYAENIFGWTPLLHAALLGSPEILHQLIKFNADPQGRTALAQNSLHIAATRGNFDIVVPLMQAGLKPTETDYFHRTPMQIACLQRWTSKSMANALKVQLPYGCPAKLKYRPPFKHYSQGGWLGSGVTLPQELTQERCDFDVLTLSDAENFLYEYLAIQRPVLIRNATNSNELKAMFHLWQRNKFEQEYGDMNFREVEVPYAESFGYSTTNITTVKAFLAKMKQLHQERKTNKQDLAEELPHPSYIFQTVPMDTPLLDNFTLPRILNPEVTHISLTKIQFYVGPALSGAPVHFHRSAWNVLMYGQKRWFLLPPESAFYSTQHVWDWWKDVYNKDALECVQYPGDLIFVPDMWGHAVVNLRESIGVAAEFIYGASEFSI